MDVKKDDGFVTVPYYAMRRRGKNEIENLASLFSLSLSQSFFKLGLMSFSFLNAGALFYKVFFFFNFPGASSDGLPRFKAGSAMMVGLVACIMHRFMWELIINNKLNCCENYYTCNITLCSLNTTNGKRKKIVLWLIELGNLYPPHGIYNKFSDIIFYLLFYVIVDVIYFH